MSILTEEEIRKVSLGWNWNPDMSLEEFISKNDLNYTEGIDIFNQIDKRYILEAYDKSENDKH